MNICRVCFGDHPEEHYRCSGCSQKFACPSLTVAIPLFNGRTLRGHVVRRSSRSGPDNDTSDACGPVVRRVIRPARIATERPALSEDAG